MKVSVCMITYNHEKFIRQAIDGVISQKANFSIEFIIANDCSVDRTDSIIKDAIKTPPANFSIRYVNREKNVGMMQNFASAILQCSGEFIAICEGDDYWIDDHKLQKQVDFLNSSPTVQLCGHDVYEFVESRAEKRIRNEQSNKWIGFETFARNGCAGVYTLSMVFRNTDQLKKLIAEQWVLNLDGGDHLILLHTASQNQVYVLPSTMGVYRIHSTGVWSGGDGKTQIYNALRNFHHYWKNMNLEKKQIYLLSQNRKFAYRALVCFKWKKSPRLIRVVLNRGTFFLFNLYPNGRCGFMLGNWIDKKFLQGIF